MLSCRGWVEKGGGHEGCGPEGWGTNPEKVGARRVGPQPRKSGSPKGGGQKWGPERWGFDGWRPEGWGAQNFAFFFPSPAEKFVLFFLSGGLLVDFWWCLKRPGTRMCTFGVLGLSCEAPAAQKPPGFHTTAREPKRAHLRVLVFKTPPKITRRHPEREEKNEFCGGRGKKERNFGRFRERAVLGRAVLGRRFSGRAVLGALSMTKPKP